MPKASPAKQKPIASSSTATNDVMPLAAGEGPTDSRMGAHDIGPRQNSRRRIRRQSVSELDRKFVCNASGGHRVFLPWIKLCRPDPPAQRGTRPPASRGGLVNF